MNEPRSIDASPHGHKVLSVMRAALAAVEPGAAVRAHVSRDGDRLIVDGRPFDLGSFDRVILVGAGKASVPMARAVVGLAGDRIAAGLAVTQRGHLPMGLDLGPVEIAEAGHPVPDQAGCDATRRIMELVSSANERDLVIAVLTGGGSALLAAPAPGLTVDDLATATRLMLASGAPIEELNAVRKHLSAATGGRLARLAAPATVVALVLSDVVDDPLDTIASGPLSPDPTTYADAVRVLRERELEGGMPEAVRAHLERGARDEVAETPKPGDPAFDRVRCVIVGSGALAARAAAAQARREGLGALVLSASMTGEAREVGRAAGALARDLATRDVPVPRPACVVLAGETTVQVRGKGRGGRNQELALAAAVEMEGLSDAMVVALGTDGRDGPTHAAGAVATGETVVRARDAGLDPLAHLDDNDACPFFEALGDLVVTGPTLTNVGDLLLVFAFS
ncbi:MAG: glycerate kinase [Deltaproteobacteria bacterium]|nr:glycerate kinase [Deltaproteobacteria bacterium]